MRLRNGVGFWYNAHHKTKPLVPLSLSPVPAVVLLHIRQTPFPGKPNIVCVFSDDHSIQAVHPISKE